MKIKISSAEVPFLRRALLRISLGLVKSPELCAQSCMMEGIMALVAEWFSLGGDEGAARCLRVDVCLGQSVAPQRLPDRSCRPGVERSIGRLAKVSVRKRRKFCPVNLG